MLVKSFAAADGLCPDMNLHAVPDKYYKGTTPDDRFFSPKAFFLSRRKTPNND